MSHFLGPLDVHFWQNIVVPSRQSQERRRALDPSHPHVLIRHYQLGESRWHKGRRFSLASYFPTQTEVGLGKSRHRRRVLLVRTHLLLLNVPLQVLTLVVGTHIRAICVAYFIKVLFGKYILVALKGDFDWNGEGFVALVV